MEELAAAWVYALPIALAWGAYAAIRARQTHRARAMLATSLEDGMMQPASLHPYIDPSLCLGCGTCIPACPEHDVLGLIHGKAYLVTPANCIGHGACKDVCPQDAIALVLGTEERGVDIPELSEEFETSVRGIFVAGELGGMGLIRNGIEQGRQALEAIASRLRGCGTPEGLGPDVLDVVIVGAGPAGFSASLAAHEHGLRYETVEQETLGGTVAHYPRGKIVMTAPVELPMYGKVELRETTKEALLALWEDVAERTGVRVSYSERVDAVERAGSSSFVVRTNRRELRARFVLLAIGRRGTPRKLGVAGEDRSKVVYRLIDAEQYRGQHVLVVGGGDSALEAATSLADVAGTTVTLSYRQKAFGRAKAKNRERLATAKAAGLVEVWLGSTVLEIGVRKVALDVAGERREIPNDAVIVCAGGVLPTSFLEAAGIAIETRHGER
ncbi:MAG: NAD(P)-binding domain-containing protein [Myxococcales bacterium]|nr:NAD(P)-binding domain-containing protein [Myxococcales bacterium]